jgi:uncharacterized membrane protein (DUF485 family)
MSGVILSVLQWAILYQRIHKAWRWAVYSSAGWIVGYILYVILSAKNTGFLAGPVIGITVGNAQWLLLRKEIYWVGWWIISSIIAWTAGLNIIPGMFTSGTLPGALTGFTLVLLFRFSSS